MYYLLCFLWLLGGGNRHVVNGQFVHADDDLKAYPGIAPVICQSGDCVPLKLDEDDHFEVKLSTGSYEIRYSNSWHQTVSRKLMIQSDTLIQLRSGDFLPREKYPVWEAYQEEAHLIIKEISEGDFGDSERSITFVKAKGTTEVQLEDPKSDLSARKMLSSMEVWQLEDFLRKVDLYDDKGTCDLAIRYYLQIGKYSFQITDKSCELQHLETILYDLYVKSWVSRE